MALGATWADVMHACFQHTTRMVMIGAGGGLLLAFGTLRLLRHSIAHVSDLSMAGATLAAGATVAVWAAATFVAARRAAAIPLSETLRAAP